MSVPTVDATSPRQGEIDYLDRLVANCKPGSYLSMLFTAEMTEWVKERIRKDMPPDLHLRYTSTLSDLVIAQKSYEDQANTLRNREKSLAFVQDQNARNQTELNSMRVQLDRAHNKHLEELRALQDQLESYQKESEASGSKIFQYNEGLERLQRFIVEEWLLGRKSADLETVRDIINNINEEIRQIEMLEREQQAAIDNEIEDEDNA